MKAFDHKINRSEIDFVHSLTYLFVCLFFSRPAGSEAEVPAGSADIGKSSNPDHVGGFQVALPIFTGIESKFGLVLPKFATGTLNVPLSTSKS